MNSVYWFMSTFYEVLGLKALCYFCLAYLFCSVSGCWGRRGQWQQCGEQGGGPGGRADEAGGSE